MSLWCRIRRVWLPPAVLLASALLLGLAGSGSAIAPTVIGGGGAAVTWSTLVPLAWSAVIAHCLARRGSTVERGAGLRLLVLDLALVVGSTAIAAVVLAWSAPAVDSATLLASHIAVLTGIAVTALSLFGPAVAVATSTALVLVTFSYSTELPAAEYVRVLQPGADPTWSLILAVVASAAAVVALVTCREGKPSTLM